MPAALSSGLNRVIPRQREPRAELRPLAAISDPGAPAGSWHECADWWRPTVVCPAETKADRLELESESTIELLSLLRQFLLGLTPLTEPLVRHLNYRRTRRPLGYRSRGWHGQQSGGIPRVAGRSAGPDRE
ncbi:protein of unknown function [Modestobacter italicus]|uniref:Uncharacterized protein n=1 Tax=Modestobacter italicus (strain DSM 44449 / CECT 9708 / BC 501) TaxID=2732864 RepID=I4EYP9_MODI5|nr:protein of unknown function [Modestobacter marinus]